MQFDKMKIWVPYNNITINPTGYNGKHICLYYFSENGELFLDVFNSLNIRPFNVRNLYVPTILGPINSILGGTFRKQIQDHKLYPVRANIGDYSRVFNKNFYFDSSLFLHNLQNRYNFKRFNVGKSYNAYSSFINTLNGVSVETHDRVFMYTINLDKALPSSITLRKSFILYKMLADFYAGKREFLPFDKIMLVLYGSTTPTKYIIIYEKDNPRNNISRFRRMVMYNTHDKKEIEDLDIDTISDIASEEAVKDTELEDEKLKVDKIIYDKPFSKTHISPPIEEIEPEVEAPVKVRPVTPVLNKKNNIKSIIKNAVKTLLNTDHHKVDLKAPAKIDYNKLAATSLVYSSTGGDLNKTKEIVYKASQTKQTDKKIINTFTEKLIPKVPIKSTSRNSLTQVVHPDQLVGGASPSHIFEKRRIDFKDNLLQDIYNAFKVLENKTIPLKILDIKVSTIKDNAAELKPSINDRFTVTLLDPFNKEQVVTVELPHLTDNGTFFINGQNKVLVTQIITFPIFFLKPGLGKFESSYATVTVHSKELQKGAYLILFMGSYKLPIIMYLAYKLGFTEALAMFNISYKLYAKKFPGSVKLAEDKYIVFTASDETARQVIESFYKSIPAFPKDEEVNLEDKLFWRTTLENDIGNRNAAYLLDQVYTNVVTPVEVQVLKNRNFPTDIKDIIKYLCIGAAEGRVDDRSGVDKLRIRTAELFVAFLQKQILKSYNEYSAKVLSSDENAKFYINPKEVYSTVVNSQNVQTLENINPIEELSMMTRITPVGEGGIPDMRAVSQDSMNVHYTYYGNIDPLDTPSAGGIGIQQHLSIGASITDNRGTFLVKDRNQVKPNDLLSTTSSMIPFVESNDGVRVSMSCGQSKQAISLLNPENPAVQTGFESLLTNFLSDSYIKKSPVDGVIIEVTPLQILIKEKTTNNIIAIDTTPVLLKSGQGKNGYGRFNNIVTVGQKIKKGEIISEGSNIKYGMISNGVNVLCAYMPYRGYNFEDGMIVSETLAKKFTSLHMEDKNIYLDPAEDVSYIAKIGDVLSKGSVLMTHSKTIYDVETLINERSEGGKIVNIEIFSNVPEEEIPTSLLPQYEEFKQRYINLKGTYPIGSFKEKKIKFEGILVHFVIQQELKLVKGDKLNQRHFNKGVCCYSTDTEVFTKDGWKLFKDLDQNDEVAYMNDNGKTEFIKPDAFHEYHYNGIMYGCKNKKIDYLVTPNHRMYVAKYKKDYEIELAERMHNKSRNIKTTIDLNFELYKDEVIKFDNNYPSSTKPPEELFNTNRENLEELFWSLIKGDGTIRNEEYVNFFTTSIKLKEDVSRLATLLGYNVISNNGESKDRKNIKYSVYIQLNKKENWIGTRGEFNPYYTIDYNDKVYCLTVKNGLLFVRRNGKAMWSGNSLILSPEEQPVTPWGEKIDMIYNPLSIINRMNSGQLSELHVGLISKKLGTLFTTIPRSRIMPLLAKILTVLDGTDNQVQSKSMISHLNSVSDIEYKAIVEEIKANNLFFPIIVPPFKSPSRKNILVALAMLDLKPSYKLYLPKYGKYTDTEVAVGYIYVYKLEHMGEKKIHTRSTGPYSGITASVTQGKKREGGSMFGELDLFSLLAWDCNIIIDECWGSLSNDHKTKNEMISEIMQTGKTKFKQPKTENPTREVFKYSMLSIHLGSI